MAEIQLDSALDLMRRLPPQQTEKNLSDLIDLVPHLCEDLLASVDQPLRVAKDEITGKEFLQCDITTETETLTVPHGLTNTFQN